MISFFTPYRHDFVRIAACVPRIEVADPTFNADRTLELLRQGHQERIALMVFPELGISAYAIDDLLHQDALLKAVEHALSRLAEESADLFPAFVVGAPLRLDGRLYNAAVVIHAGRILGVVPKAYLPNYREFYERRHFAPGASIREQMITLAGLQVPFGVDLLFRSAGSCAFTFHVEICEDMWVPQPPSTTAALAGAEILLNLSASNITIGKAEDRRLLCGSQSMRCIAAYAYSAAGPGESTTDLAWDGHGGIFEDGLRLAETGRFPPDSTMAVADIDLGRLRQERMRRVTFRDCADELKVVPGNFRIVPLHLDAPEEALALRRPIERFPYVPADPAKLAENCYEAYNIQVQGLAKRLQATRTEKVVIGVSGGLDSTQALLVCCRAMDKLGLPRTNILAYTLPGFATSEGTKGNAWALMRALGVTASEIDIRPAARQVLKDLGHPFAEGEPAYDVTFENVQAGLRTDYLFRLANHHRGIVVGTGDLSELGLGWCTYGVGDQMSHYNVNASVAKTLIQHLIRFVAASGDVDEDTANILYAILATEISPELVPQDASGQIQSTEAMIGPYALQDFNLYYLTRYGFRPSKIAYLSWQAWRDKEAGTWPPNIPETSHRAYELGEIKKWLRVFLSRFFTSQFKRTAMPNGPKISSGGSLSPRGDWRAPSDAGPGIWLAELEDGVPDAESS
ncbi:NAD(+) synthase [Microvirga lotononidis]|uniref:Glutamine-dependent NAD(+) synthetase n=1 Tax=Microvirga lotononidis TaxID=864069 RepID=I4YXX5_9HYPH|nr:NAD(+) synthase [Microvirga lotononidis]EIM28817.1 NAD synthase [Microvirga lotononidis]WQO25453.1 NAD(+) synthase [Microvirga lotononidis]